MPRELKRLTKRQAQQKGEAGLFGYHLWSLLDSKGWSKDDLLTALATVEDHVVRSWLRGDNMPRTKELRKIGAALGLADYRQILPE